MDRVDADLFYDREVVGLTHGARRGHRGVAARRFFVAQDPLAARPHFLSRIAARPWAYAGILFGMGFFAVFVRQAELIIQVILGAPIFEEMVKFGLAMVLSLALVALLSGFRRDVWAHPAWMLLRLPIALAVGAGFGFLEHVTTYPEESDWSYVWRVMFHGFSTGTTMIAYQAALRADDARAVWLAPLPSIFIHYLNNYGAIVLGLGSLVLPVLGTVATVTSAVLVVTLAILGLLMLLAPGATSAAMEHWVPLLPDREA